MAGLDDAGMHRADRDFVQILALDGQELVRRRRGHSTGGGGEGLGDAPDAVIQPRPPVRQTHRIQAEQVARGALQPDRRRVQAADRRERAIGAG